MSGRLFLLAATTVGSVLIFLCALQGWYYQRYEWPADIQNRLFGRQVVDDDTLIKYEGYAHFGQGAFTWYYAVDAESLPRIARFCGQQPIKTCQFDRSYKLQEGIDLYARYSGGVMLLDESWS